MRLGEFDPRQRPTQGLLRVGGQKGSLNPDALDTRPELGEQVGCKLDGSINAVSEARRICSRQIEML
jgi:hypothetical protein